MKLKDFPCFVDHHQHTHVDISCCCNNYSVSLLCLTLSALNLHNALCYSMLNILMSTKISWQILQNTRQETQIKTLGTPLNSPRCSYEPRTMVSWLEMGLKPRTMVRWLEVGLEARTMVRWLEVGLEPRAKVRWLEVGLEPRSMVR